MNINGIKIEKKTDYEWIIPKVGKMNVPGKIYSDEKSLVEIISHDDSFKQVINVATLPGIIGYSIAMPDIHAGYGFPIGGVAAFDYNEGIISPGGVGYDINCGVRLALTNLNEEDVINKRNKIIQVLFEAIPTGVGSSNAIKKVSKEELKRVALKGARWAVENGYGKAEDLSRCEENGGFVDVSFEGISQRAIERGLDQIGTLGSGNHFLEIQIVDEIYDEKIAKKFGLRLNQVCFMIHTGSRGFGYQICEDYLKDFIKAASKYKIDLLDRQLACAPIVSPEGQAYLNAMKCAANFAWNNRQVIMELSRRAIKKALSISDNELGFQLLYDVSHNIAKIEVHEIEGERKKVCVHRKGATRAFPKNSPYISKDFEDIGQPVLIPGDMGRYSFVLVGTEEALKETFGSSCHGAGRVMSRNKAIELAKGRDIAAELSKKGIIVKAKAKATLAEEMPEAYKDARLVVDIAHYANIAKKVARLKPIGVIKG